MSGAQEPEYLSCEWHAERADDDANFSERKIERHPVLGANSARLRNIEENRDRAEKLRRGAEMETQNAELRKAVQGLLDYNARSFWTRCIDCDHPDKCKPRPESPERCIAGERLPQMLVARRVLANQTDKDQ